MGRESKGENDPDNKCARESGLARVQGEAGLRKRLLIVALMTLNACSIRQTVEPVRSGERMNVCVIRNPYVRGTILDALHRRVAA